MAKRSINQIQIGNYYNSEEYFDLAPDGKAGVCRYFFTGDNLSCALNMVPPGMPTLPEHSHPHEQCLVVPQGDGKAMIDGVAYDTEPGFFALFPPDVPHGYDTSEATYTCWNLDIFVPERLEYEKENYLRLLAQGKDTMKTMITKDTE